MTTEELYEQFLSERRSTQDFDPKEIRLSELGGCPRKATLRILGYEADQTSLQQEAVFHAGDVAEAMIGQLWSRRFPRRIRRQVPVRWKYGTGHIDLWIAPIRRIVECKTVRKTAERYLPHKEHVAQVTAYLGYWGRERGATAEIAYFLKETGEIKTFPVEFDEALFAKIRETAESIYRAAEAGEPLPIPDECSPERFPCGWTTQDGATATCPYFQHCWKAKEDENATQAPEIPELGIIARALYEVEQEYSRLSRLLNDVKTQRDQLRTRLGHAMQSLELSEVRAGEIYVKRTEVPGRVSYDIQRMIEDGVVDEDTLGKYAKNGRRYERWTIKKVS